MYLYVYSLLWTYVFHFRNRIQNLDHEINPYLKEEEKISIIIQRCKGSRKKVLFTMAVPLSGEGGQGQGALR